jgi:hypothetical protein
LFFILFEVSAQDQSYLYLGFFSKVIDNERFIALAAGNQISCRIIGDIEIPEMEAGDLIEFVTIY